MGDSTVQGWVLCWICDHGSDGLHVIHVMDGKHD